MKQIINFFICILVISFFVSYHSLSAQNLENQPGDTLTFSLVKMRDGNLYIGKIIEQTESQLILRDNVLGKIAIPLAKIKELEEEDLQSNYLIILSNGNKLNGTIIAKRMNDFDFNTSLGVITLKANQIHKMKKIEGMAIVEGEYIFPNPNATRYFFAPSAIPLKKGEGYYQNAYVIANSANYGLEKNFSLGGGLLLPVAVYITPKLGFEVAKNFYAGGGALLGLFPEATGAGILYGLVTYGSIENNITLGTGYGFLSGEKTDKPIVTVNGMVRAGRKIAFVTENWFVTINEHNDITDTEEYVYKGFFSYGARFMWDRFTIDAAFINGSEIVDIFPIGIPYIDFVVKF
ncbi:hypothetical protein ACFLSA_02770 [Bacteroidota bacterium]